MRKIAGVIAAIAVIGSAVVAGTSASAATTIASGGSSFAGNLLVPCANSFTGASVTYVSSSSGTGRKNFQQGTFDFAAADVPYGATDTKPTAFTYVPVVGGPIAIPLHVEGLTALNLTPSLLGKILRGDITNWNDAAIKKLNKSQDLPNATINVIYRSGSSGTSANLTQYLQDTKAPGWTANGTWATATGKTTPVGTPAANSSALVALVKTTPNAIGYADLTDVNKKGLYFAALKNGAGKFIKPSVKAASLFLSAQKIDAATGLVALKFTQKIKGAYNLSIVTYGLAPTAAADAAKGSAVKGFVNYVLKTCAPANAANLGYVALKGGILKAALALAAKIK
jgi:phosphate transport system substrate-binding protein